MFVISWRKKRAFRASVEKCSSHFEFPFWPFHGFKAFRRRQGVVILWDKKHVIDVPQFCNITRSYKILYTSCDFSMLFQEWRKGPWLCKTLMWFNSFAFLDYPVFLQVKCIGSIISEDDGRNVLNYNMLLSLPVNTMVVICYGWALYPTCPL